MEERLKQAKAEREAEKAKPTESAPGFTPGPLNIMEGKTLLHLETDATNPIGAGVHICSFPKSYVGRANANRFLSLVETDNYLRNQNEIFKNHCTKLLAVLNAILDETMGTLGEQQARQSARYVIAEAEGINRS
jgi:hypothetical protein